MSKRGVDAVVADLAHELKWDLRPLAECRACEERAAAFLEQIRRRQEAEGKVRRLYLILCTLCVVLYSGCLPSVSWARSAVPNTP